MLVFFLAPLKPQGFFRSSLLHNSTLLENRFPTSRRNFLLITVRFHGLPYRFFFPVPLLTNNENDCTKLHHHIKIASFASLVTLSFLRFVCLSLLCTNTKSPPVCHLQFWLLNLLEYYTRCTVIKTLQTTENEETGNIFDGRTLQEKDKRMKDDSYAKMETNGLWLRSPNDDKKVEQKVHPV